MGIVKSLPTLEPIQVMLIAEALFEGFFKNPAITDNHGVEEGIKGKKEIVIIGHHTGLSGVLKGQDCDTTVNDSWEIPTSNKTWDPEYIGDTFEECWADYLQSFIRWGLKNGIKAEDLTSTELAAFIITHLTDLMFYVVMRHAYFGDKGIVAETGNAIVAGDIKFFDVIDGFFVQLFDIIGADPARLSATGLATKNAEATFALQKFNDTDTTNQVVTKALDSLLYDSDMRLRAVDRSKLVIKTTQTVYDQYERERKALGGGAILEVFKRTEDGVQNLTINGIEIVPQNWWDQIIQTYFTDSGAYVLPHRAVLTTRENFVIGTEDVGTFSELDVWFSKERKALVIEYLFQLDVKIGLDNMVQAAY